MKVIDTQEVHLKIKVLTHSPFFSFIQPMTLYILTLTVGLVDDD